METPKHQQCSDRTVITEQQKKLLAYGWDRIPQTIYHGFCMLQPTNIVAEIFYTVLEGSGHNNTQQVGHYQVLSSSAPADRLLRANQGAIKFECVKNTKRELLVDIRKEKNEKIATIEEYYKPAIEYCSTKQVTHD